MFIQATMACFTLRVKNSSWKNKMMSHQNRMLQQHQSLMQIAQSLFNKLTWLQCMRRETKELHPLCSSSGSLSVVCSSNNPYTWPPGWIHSPRSSKETKEELWKIPCDLLTRTAEASYYLPLLCYEGITPQPVWTGTGIITQTKTSITCCITCGCVSCYV